ncbi:S8 family serine peptidase [uncultured Thiohalocapsa sp.]|uniref:S8 family serine peptidase n=1 Tax=uncultured Thiohalocapsa sp. TaxID=768990 RepID=UPI0025FAF18E|nr:S8 family serine peptidase [uncultured Thiohalocapsa sp.]
MRNSHFPLLILLGVCLPQVLAAADWSDEVPQALLDEAASSFVFVLEDSVAPGEVRGLARRLTLENGGRLRHVFHSSIRGFSASVPAAAAARIAAAPRVAYYEPNAVYRASGAAAVPEDGGGSGSAGPGRRTDDDDDAEATAQATPWGIARIGGPIDGTGLHAWIIDTGIDLDHADLNVGIGANFVTLGRVAGPDDDNGHGTHVAGTVAALDNQIDVVGAAPNATVHPVKVLSKTGFGLTDAIVAGIDYVAANAAPGDCANMSLGGLGHQASIHDAVTAAAALGIRFSLAAGNESSDAVDYEPAHVDAPNVYTVSAIDSNDVFAVFSNYGAPVDFAAPGVAILSTSMGGGTSIKSGTSMAAPHVCGILLHMAPPNADGEAIADPDGDPDPIAHF